MRVRPVSVALGLILASGLALRLAGLNHDLDAGYNYHPDAAKHLRAAEAFLSGGYFIHMGISDWDGYPLFNSHLLELVLRAYRNLATGACLLLGIPGPVDYPAYEQNGYFWIGRLMNVTIATVAVGVAYRIGKRCFGVAAGLLAALFLAWSPIDVVACHYEGGDTTAAFFAALSTLFALRILDGARLLDYVLATFFATAGFAAKYHAGSAFVPIAVAHLLYWRPRAGLWSLGSLGRMALVLAAGFDSLTITMPALQVAPADALTDILGYFHYLWASTEQRIPELVGVGFLGRMSYSIRHQVPVLMGIVGPWFVAILLLGAARLWRRREALLVLASLPLAYLFGVSVRPVVQPVYHTLVMPSLFVLGAGVLAMESPAGARASVGALALRGLLAILCASALMRGSLREDFFFLRMDTQRMGFEWMRENVPATFARVIGDYSIVDWWSDPPPLPGREALFATGRQRPIPVPPDATFLKRMSLEPLWPLPVFRNPTAELYARASWLDRDGFHVPALARRPATFASDFEFLGGHELYRSGSIVTVEREESIERVFASETALGDVLLFVQNGEDATTLSLSFAGTDRRILLGPAESISVTVPSPRASFPSDETHHFYRLRLSADQGTVWVTVASNALAKGWELYQRAQYAESAPWLAAAARASRDPLVAGLAAISEAVAGSHGGDSIGELAAPLRAAVDEAKLDERYGGAIRYLSGLEYFSAEAEDAELTGFEVVSDAGASGRKAIRAADRLPQAGPEADFDLPMFAPGLYTAWLRARCQTLATSDRPIEIGLFAPSQEDELTERIPPPFCQDGGYVEVRVPLAISRFRPRWRLGVRSSPGCGILVDRITIAPDLVSTWSAVGRVLGAVTADAGEALSEGDFLAYEPLLALADRLFWSGERDRAMRLYALAAPLRVEKKERNKVAAKGEEAPAEAEAPHQLDRAFLAAAKTLHPADVSFEGGVSLTGYRLREQRVSPGSAIHLSLYWEAGNTERALGDAVVWIHFLDRRGRLAFVGDQRLVDLLGLERDSREPLPPAAAIKVPASVAAGSYRIQVGLSSQNKRLRARSSNLPVERRGVMLPAEILVAHSPT